MTQVTVEQAMSIAVEHHRAERLADAEKIYRQVLAQQPDNAEALRLLGILAGQVGRHDDGMALLRRAIQLRPDHAEAYSDLGLALSAQGKVQDAVAAHRRAIQCKPNHARAYCNLGNMLCELGLFDEAAAACRQSIHFAPGLFQAYNNLGNALIGQRKFDEAVAAYRGAIGLNAEYFEAYHNLGAVLHKQGKFGEAVEAEGRSVQINPSFADAYSNLGASLTREGRLDEAVAACRHSIQLKPGYANAHSNLGGVLKEQAKFNEAIVAFRRAIEIKPDFGDAHWNLALVLLLLGELGQGWAEYEWRWICPEFTSSPRGFTEPQWRGEPLNGRTILLHAEQGFGDTIQFVRYVSDVLAQGGQIILECQEELHRLLKDFPGVQQVIITGQSLPAFDLYCPLLSLPMAFGTQLDSIPRSIPYIRADPQLIETWLGLLHDEEGGLKVGLAWAGRPTHINDRHRSLKFEQLAPLALATHAHFYSLHKRRNDRAGEPAVATSLQVTDFSDKLTDFADTAAMIANLDLVITVDTAVAHLAGAMGKPVWVLLPFVPDWRWLLEREDSPWYPTMQLFRQKAIGQWDQVIARVAASLSQVPRNR